MNRRLVACASPVALFAGVFLLHCSSSSSTGTSPDSGAKDGSTHHDASTDSGKKDSGKSDAGAPVDAGHDAGHDAGNDAGPPFVFNPDAACIAIDGGAACDPGVVLCPSPTACTVPGNECCNGGGPDASDICLPADASCGAGGLPEGCNETRDCADHQLCCLSVYVIGNATMPSKGQTACQTYGDAGRVCNDPLALVQAQICKSDDECASGHCVRYDCEGTLIVSCANPYPGVCNVDDGGAK
jgi:hypothetical protein